MAKLVKKIEINGTIVLKTGLHIGGTNAAMNIGGPDKFVVRNPLTQKPYIPGSSLKGKLRSLLELSRGEIDTNGEKSGPSSNPNHLSAKLFGTAADRGGHPSRILVRDSELITPEEEFSNTDLLYTESKTEVSIDRITAKAQPRTFERVPAGAKFCLNMVLNIFEGDDESELKKGVSDAINLLEKDYLGGNGSRGYGQVVFENLTENHNLY